MPLWGLPIGSVRVIVAAMESQQYIPQILEMLCIYFPLAPTIARGAPARLVYQVLSPRTVAFSTLFYPRGTVRSAGIVSPPSVI